MMNLTEPQAIEVMRTILKSMTPKNKQKLKDSRQEMQKSGASILCGEYSQYYTSDDGDL